MRKSARSQRLPQEEIDYLRTLTGVKLRARAFQLFEAGWTLSAIGEPLDRPRSTVRFWVTNSPMPQLFDRPLPTPQDKTYVHKKPKYTPIPDATKQRLATLAPIAQRYRAKLPSNHPATIANEELTALAISLHATHVPIQEIANAAGVTYRAMYRRIHRR